MRRLTPADRSAPVAIWLFAVAALVFAMAVVGGATRLTHSGLSITEWKPISGVIPPLNHAQWIREFAGYQRIPEYQQINRGMSLGEFKGIFWWEWAHRLLGRLVGFAFLLPFLVFLALRAVPPRLVWRCAVLFALGGLQGLVGWWMVASGLEVRTDVAPERLATHLGLALLILVGSLWTGAEALAGPSRARPATGWVRGAQGVFGLAYLQCMLGALVAGNDAGLIDNDWPMMAGKLLPQVDWARGPLHAFLHDRPLVQFDHRLGAYALLAAASLYAVQVVRAPMSDGIKLGAAGVAGVVWLQAALGVATLMTAVPLALGALHQAGAVIVLSAATLLLWRVRRSDARLFT